MVEKKDKLIIGDTWEEIGLDIPINKLGFTRDLKVKGCPQCKLLGKRNELSVSVQPIDGIAHCFKCGHKFAIRKEQFKRTERVDKKEFTPPSKANLTALSKEGVAYFNNRRISQEAINFFKIVQGKHGYVAFPYFFNGELVNIKFKNITEKKYMQSPNGKHVVFNYDEAKKFGGAILVAEGEEECMCWYDAGVSYAVSVDSGAPNPNDKIDRKLECIDNSIDIFEVADVIFIAVDNDDNGRRLEQELIRRFKVEKVRVVSYAPYKDANEYVMHEGRDKLKALLATAREIKMEGIYTVSDARAELMHMWTYGLPKGTTTHFPSIDECWKWRPSEVTIATGYANDGKSTLYNVNLPMTKAVFDGWRFGLFIPENFPAAEFYDELIQCYVGKMTDKDYPAHRMTEEEYVRAMDFIEKYFFLVYPEEKQTLESIFELFDYLVRRYGLNAVIIDPYNSIEHLIRPGETIDQYVTRFMGMLRAFARKRNLCVILVAHQNPPEKKTASGDYPEPDMYRVKNGGSFADRADNLVVVHRPMRFSDPKNPTVVVASKKIKKKKLLMADTQSCEIDYYFMSNRYTDPKLKDRSPLDVQKIVEQKEIDELYEAEEIPF